MVDRGATTFLRRNISVSDIFLDNLQFSITIVPSDLEDAKYIFIHIAILRAHILFIDTSLCTPCKKARTPLCPHPSTTLRPTATSMAPTMAVTCTIAPKKRDAASDSSSLPLPACCYHSSHRSGMPIDERGCMNWAKCSTLPGHK